MSNGALLLKRGLAADFESVTLQEGELAVLLDTSKVYVGTASGNTCINPDQEEIRITVVDVEGLLVDGKLDESLIPSIAIVDVFEASSEAEMLALSEAKQGDVCVRSDINKSFILKTAPYSTLENWVELRTPTDTVLKVNGKTGLVTLTAADVGAVPTGRKVNGKELSDDVTLTAADVGAIATGSVIDLGTF